MRYAEYNQNDRHDCEGRQQDKLGAVKPPELWTSIQRPIFVAPLDQPPSSNSEFISAHESKQAGDYSEVHAYRKNCQPLPLTLHISQMEDLPDLIFVPLLSP